MNVLRVGSAATRTMACGAVLLLGACQHTSNGTTAVAAATPGPVTDTVQAYNDRVQLQKMREISGHELEMAEDVFSNVKWLKGITAKNFLEIMNGGYAKALGVKCSYCHVMDDFASDTLRPKRAAREMAVMHRMINTELRKMQNLQPMPNRAISCITCHRGQINPMAAK